MVLPLTEGLPNGLRCFLFFLPFHQLGVVGPEPVHGRHIRDNLKRVFIQNIEANPCRRETSPDSLGDLQQLGTPNLVVDEKESFGACLRAYFCVAQSLGL